MAFSFEYMDIKSKQKPIKDTTPAIKIYNCSQTAQSSYFFLNKAAVELLNIQKDAQVRVGIDKETKKIVIVPTNNDTGRRVTHNMSGSATISLTRLIEENNIPTQECPVIANKNYAYGGIIFTYTT